MILQIMKKIMPEILIMISGRGSNMEAIIQNTRQGCLTDLCEVTSVFSNKKDAPGLKIAKNFGIPTCVIESKGKKLADYNDRLKEYLIKIDPHLIILAGYMKLLPSGIVSKFSNRIINIHPADTTLHQGLHGYGWAFNNKLNETRITVHYVDEGLDSGEIIGQKTVDLQGVSSLEEVEKRGLKAEHEFYSECLKKILTAKHGKTPR
jgi:phosphoribosylglycinamide formyltransferase 1